MSSSESSRFTAPNKTTQQRLSNNTVGLVKLSDFRKRRAEVLEQQEREIREAAAQGRPPIPVSTPDRSQTGTPDNTGETSDFSVPRKKKKKIAKSGGTKLSFGDDDTNEEDGEADLLRIGSDASAKDDKDGEKISKFKANVSVSFVPRSLTKSALRREAAEREVLRKEFLLRQEALKTTEIAIPFIFYDGSNIPAGTVRVKKGDFIWVFLDKSRKVGADSGVGEKAKARRAWARVGVDDLMLVRGNVIIPHHYEFLFFIMNKTAGPEEKVLFDYSTEAPKAGESLSSTEDVQIMKTPSVLKSASTLPDINTLEGANDDPNFTKVVDRRWYERNKHIYPASTWQDFDPEKDYTNEIRRDRGGNAFFYS